MLIEHEKNGILVPVGDAQAMAQGMAKYLENPKYAAAVGEAARASAVDYLPEKINSQWEVYIQQLTRA